MKRKKGNGTKKGKGLSRRENKREGKVVVGRQEGGGEEQDEGKKNKKEEEERKAKEVTKFFRVGVSQASEIS